MISCVVFLQYVHASNEVHLSTRGEITTPPPSCIPYLSTKKYKTIYEYQLHSWWPLQTFHKTYWALTIHNVEQSNTTGSCCNVFWTCCMHIKNRCWTFPCRFLEFYCISRQFLCLLLDSKREGSICNNLIETECLFRTILLLNVCV